MKDDRNPKLIHPYNVMPTCSCYYNREEGILKIDGGYFLCGNYVVLENEYEIYPSYESPFVHLGFHTVIVGARHLCEGCFNGCKGLKKIILDERVQVIEYPITGETSVDYFNDNGLLFLGSYNNPRYA